MEQHTVLLIGGGGRESALAWKIAQSAYLKQLYIAPGNAGTEQYGANVPIAATDIQALCDFAITHHVSFVIVGPDDPLSLGAVDAFRALSIPVFGPTRNAAQLEWSKAYSKEVMLSAKVPTAAYATHTNYAEALAYAQSQTLPIVIKASGLALGKGVYICTSAQEVTDALEEIMLKKVHKDAGDAVVIEQFLVGREISAHAISDGTTTHLFPPAQDHKRAGELDTGKNTGGMGTIAPVPWVTDALQEKIRAAVVSPTLSYMKSIGITFTGCLFPGLMITDDDPFTLEFNARFGDPETQVYMRLLESDVLELLFYASIGQLSRVTPSWKQAYAVNIVLASAGYPDSYEKGKVIKGISEAETVEGVIVFHAGTQKKEGAYVTSGGRVLGVSALGSSLNQALQRAYEAVDHISFEGKQYRRDIGKKSLA